MIEVAGVTVEEEAGGADLEEEGDRLVLLYQFRRRKMHSEIGLL